MAWESQAPPSSRPKRIEAEPAGSASASDAWLRLGLSQMRLRAPSAYFQSDRLSAPPPEPPRNPSRSSSQPCRDTALTAIMLESESKPVSFGSVRQRMASGGDASAPERTTM